MKPDCLSFNPQDSHGRRRKPSSRNCSLASTFVLWRVHTYTHKHKHTQHKNLNLYVEGLTLSISEHGLASEVAYGRGNLSQGHLGGGWLGPVCCDNILVKRGIFDTKVQIEYEGTL